MHLADDRARLGADRPCPLGRHRPARELHEVRLGEHRPQALHWHAAVAAERVQQLRAGERGRGGRRAAREVVAEHLDDERDVAAAFPRLDEAELLDARELALGEVVRVDDELRAGLATPSQPPPHEPAEEQRGEREERPQPPERARDVQRGRGGFGTRCALSAGSTLGTTTRRSPTATARSPPPSRTTRSGNAIRIESPTSHAAMRYTALRSALSADTASRIGSSSSTAPAV